MIPTLLEEIDFSFYQDEVQILIKTCFFHFVQAAMIKSINLNQGCGSSRIFFDSAFGSS